jgi:amyloid beta precursor protein binding protein 1
MPDAFPIVDTHPDPASTQDLRLLSPWPELTSFAQEKTKGLEGIDAEEHGHVPYVLLLLHYLEQWKTEHDGKLPDNYKEKSAFRDFVRHGARTKNAEGGEENFDEAVAAVLKSLNPPMASSSVKEVLQAPECLNLSKEVCLTCSF